MEQVAVKLTDTQWRLKCEALAKAELELVSMSAEFDVEALEWKELKKKLEGRMEIQSQVIQKLAREVDTKEELQDPQASLDMGADDNPAPTPA